MNKVKVSVIVPIYNVEEYLRECLDSIVNQTFKDIEVIMVDDGSTDNSYEIAKEYDKKYNNFYAITKPNGGLGQARNFGLNYVRGEYIIFMDSDDYIALDAYEKMYKMAKKTGSDIVVGNVKRFNSKGIFASGLHKKIFKETIESTHITKMPELIYDTTSWNKLFKTSFWKENNFKFPEGVLYEDIPVTVPAHFKAKSVSILEDDVYFWRVRDGISKSITQNRTDPKNLLDRIYVMKLVNSFYDKNVNDDVAYYSRNFKWLDVDLKLYIDEIIDSDQMYKELLVKEVSAFLKDIPKEIRNDLKAIDKIKYYLIENNRIDELVEVVKYQKTKLKYLEVEKVNNIYFGKFPFENIPKEYFDMTSEILNSKEYKKIEKMYWNNDTLNIKGFMFIPKINIKDKKDINVKATIINLNDDKRVDIEVELFKRRDTTQKYGVKVNNNTLLNRIYNYKWSGFEIKIDFSDERIKNLGEGKKKILITYEVGSISKKFYLGEPVAGNKVRPKPHLSNGYKIINSYNLAYELIISSYIENAGINIVEVKDGNICLSGWTDYDNKLMAIDWDNNVKLYYKIENNENRFNVRIPLDDFEKFNNDSEWYLYYFKAGKREPLTANIGAKTIYEVRGKNLINISISAAGTIRVKYDKLRSYIDDVEWEGNKLQISCNIGSEFFGTKKIAYKTELVLSAEASKKEIVVDMNSYVNEGNLIKYTFELDFNNTDIYKQFLADIWLCGIRFTINNKQFKHMILANNKEFSLRKDINKHRFNPFVSKKGYFGINVTSKWKWYEKGPIRREFIESYIYPIMRKLPMNSKTIVFEGWWAKKYHCNPRYFYEYMQENHPEYKCIWSLNDENIDVKGNAKKVKHGSLKYFYYMATSKYFVNNVNFSDSYEKRKNAVEIQTMHGTPLKTLGLDVKDEFPTQEHVDRFLRRCARWDYLVVQSDAVANITDSCYAYEKEYLKTGYPRNDILFNKNNEKDINEIKKELNIPTDKKVILYAPTWRIRDKFDFEFDIKEMKRRLGDEYVLITRIHPFAIKGFNRNNIDEFVRDFSDYESIEKLYLISDILITDYSSVMFDYAILDRPILFYTYDLELYRDNLRGFNLDFEEEAPGPLIKESHELIRAIENIEDVKVENAERMKKFREKYCQYEKGNASEQIFNTVFRKK